MPTLRTVTFGCKVNQYETEYLREGFQRLGFTEAGPDEAADLCIVNTCTVTIQSEAKSRKMIRHLARQNPHAEIIVMGCYATQAAAEIAAMPGVVEVLADKRQLGDLLVRRGLPHAPPGISTFSGRHRAFIKVQDGCAMQCSYCIIPNVRSVTSSRPPADVLDEIGRLVQNGYREIVLTGIHLGHYGRNGRQSSDAGAGPGLPDLLRQTVAMEGEFRMRLSSLDAVEVSEELLDLMARQSERLCPHLHIPLQSGSDRVLARMRRRWPVSRIIERCRRVAAALDRPGLGTDVIVGFPGETDDDFSATCRAVEEAGFSKIHVFRFSPRHGTPAATMPDQVPVEIQQERAATLSGIGDRLQHAYCERLAGQRLQVLVEGVLPHKTNRLLGTADRYVPVELPGGPELVGQVVACVAGLAQDGVIQANLAPALRPS